MFDLPEKITIWRKGKNSGFGDSNWDGPYVVSARIAYRQEKFTDINGDQQISKGVCYSDSPVLEPKASVYFGASKSQEPETGADDIRAISTTPSGTDLRKAWF